MKSGNNLTESGRFYQILSAYVYRRFNAARFLNSLKHLKRSEELRF